MRPTTLAFFLCVGAGPACGSGQPPAQEARPVDARAHEPGADPGSGPAATDEAPKPLSDEDKRLLAADPATLSPEERRARAYAVRRKIMLDPDSEAAKTIKEGMEAIERGELDVPAHLLGEDGGATPAGGGPMLSAPSAEREAAEGSVPLK